MCLKIYIYIILGHSCLSHSPMTTLSHRSLPGHSSPVNSLLHLSLSLARYVGESLGTPLRLEALLSPLETRKGPGSQSCLGCL